VLLIILPAQERAREVEQQGFCIQQVQSLCSALREYVFKHTSIPPSWPEALAEDGIPAEIWECRGAGDYYMNPHLELTDITLSIADVPLVWFQPPEGQAGFDLYPVAYADGQIRDVAPEDLPQGVAVKP
jgi:hypothetical protein